MKFVRMSLIALGAALALAACQTAADSSDEMGAMEDESMESESMESESMSSMSFTVTVQVLSDAPTPLAPVAWAVHSGSNPFVEGEMGARLEGLEALAEDGDPSGASSAVAMIGSVKSHGVANTPSGSSGPGPAAPGSSYSFQVELAEGDHLSFATMYVQSNDLFYSPGRQGLGVVMGSGAMTGNVTGEITLYDAGTEVNERPGSGPNQAPRQSAPNTGADEMGSVTPVSEVDDGFSYPPVSEVIRVTIEQM